MIRRLLQLSCSVLLVALIACKQQPPKEARKDAWYKHLLIYNVDVKTFQDSDGDGEGDLKGLTSRLTYIKGLGVNTIWLAPFQPSPQQDDGYDITDYYNIDPKLGTDADLAAFLTAAKKMNFKVVMDIVLNHSSIEHPWFRAKPNWYLWSAAKPADWDKGIGFPGVEKDTWHQDSLTKKWYFHRFYHFEPDLNYQNREVVAEAKKIMAYWLDKGLDGFRMDAVPFTIDDPRESSDHPKFDFDLLHELTAFVAQHKPGAVLLGEANVEPDENNQYFAGSHPGLQMMFNFYANQYLFYGLATGNTADLKKALIATGNIPAAAQWAWFLRNHDEIDLGRLSKKQLDAVYKAMGPDTIMQLYKRGIRRRLAPMLNNDSARLHLAYSLLYSLPGTPVIRQGEEIGMGDDLRLKERLAVRTPMQWSNAPNAGFSKGRPFRPIIDTGVYGYNAVNTVSESADQRSLLNFIRQMIALRHSYPEIINGEWQIIDTPDEILSILYTDKSRQVLITHNFSKKQQHAKILGADMTLQPYGYNWKRLSGRP